MNDDGMPKRPARTSQAEPARTSHRPPAAEPMTPMRRVYGTAQHGRADAQTTRETAIVHERGRLPALQFCLTRGGEQVIRPMYVFAREIGPLVEAIRQARDPHCPIGNREVGRFTLPNQCSIVCCVIRSDYRDAGVSLRIHSPENTPNGKRPPPIFSGAELDNLERAVRELVRIAAEERAA